MCNDLASSWEDRRSLSVDSGLGAGLAAAAWLEGWRLVQVRIRGWEASEIRHKRDVGSRGDRTEALKGFTVMGG